jgi:hypothetical protein
MFNYDKKIFKAVINTTNSSVTNDTTWLYKQEGKVVSATYTGGSIIQGNLLGMIEDEGTLKMYYHQIDINHQCKTGKMKVTPEILPDGRIRLYEEWERKGDHTMGTVIKEEFLPE